MFVLFMCARQEFIIFKFNFRSEAQARNPSLWKVCVATMSQDRSRINLLACIFLVTYGAIGVLKTLTDIPVYIGISVEVSILFLVGAVAFWTAVYLYFLVLLQFLALGSGVVKNGHEVSYNKSREQVSIRRVIMLLPLLSFVAYSSPLLLALGYITIEQSLKIFYIVQPAIILLFGTMACSRILNLTENALKKWIGAAKESAGKQKLKQTLRRISIIRVTSIFWSLLMSLIGCFGAFVPFFARMSSYILPVTMFAGLVMVVVIVWSGNHQTKFKPISKKTLGDYNQSKVMTSSSY